MVVKLDGNNFKINQLESIARGGGKVALAERAKKAVTGCRRMVEELVADGRVLYGVTTGIGSLARIKVSAEQAAELQKRIVRSHSAGYGEPASAVHVRAAIAMKINALAKGYSGVRLSTLDTLIKILNRGVVPFVNERGSVGTSGDLAPLAEIAAVVMGESKAYYGGRLLNASTALKKAKIKPVSLSYKEGLALINGPQFFTGLGALLLFDAENLIKTAQIASAMTLNALASPAEPFDARLHEVRPFNGQRVVAKNMRKLVRGSRIKPFGEAKVQDAYSLRCIPQVYGPIVDAVRYAREQIEIEMNSASDNPLFFPKDGACLSGGNFHGEPVAVSLDFVALTLCELGYISERHLNRLLNPHLSELPDFLTEGKGLNSGLMIPHYTAAALVSENRHSTTPAVADNFTVAADQEDHVCMGPVAAYKLRRLIKNLHGVLGIELLCAAQALDFREGAPSKAVAAAHELVRSRVKHLTDDRILYPDIEKCAKLVSTGEVVETVENTAGKLDMAWRK